jgi:hypothetical protein
VRNSYLKIEKKHRERKRKIEKLIKYGERERESERE